MSLLQELYQMSTEQVDSLPSTGTYIPLPDESKPKRKKTKRTASPVDRQCTKFTDQLYMVCTKCRRRLRTQKWKSYANN